MEVESKPEEIENLDRRIIQLKIEREALKKERTGVARTGWRRSRGARQPRAAVGRADPALAGREGQDRRRGEDQGAARRRADRARAGAARRRSRQGRRASIRPHPRARKAARRGAGRGQGRDAARGSDRGGHRRRRQPLDRHSGRADDGRRAREAAPDGSDDRRARDRPGGCGQGRLGRGPPRARRPAGSEPAARLLPVPRPDRRRQDRADQGARRIPVRRSTRDGPHRHERVHGEACGRAADRRASGLCRL